MRPGDLVVANVRLERLLVEGGMGSVWVADHLTLSTQVAVKFMGTEVTADGAAMARFKSEASAAAQIKSPHIVQMFDHGVTAEGVPYIVMELLHGEDLEHRLKRGPLSVGETLEVIRHLCKALGRAHQQGIVHRDIKPANLFLVDADGDIFVKVLDFGIAKRAIDDELATRTQSGTMVGTPAYMSPEQIMGARGVDARADLWAAAVVAYACLTATTPFTGNTIGGLAVAINAARYIPVTTRRPSLPSSLDAWFARALARSPDERYQSAKELSDALADAVPKDMQSVRPPTDSAPLSMRGASLRRDQPTIDERSARRSTKPLEASVGPLAANVTPRSRRIRALDALEEEPNPRRGRALPVFVALIALSVGGGGAFYANGGRVPWTRLRAKALALVSSVSQRPPFASAPAAPAAPATAAPAVVDAGSGDAGRGDAGAGDAGRGDAGGADAGSADGRSLDARSSSSGSGSGHIASNPAGHHRAGSHEASSNRVPFGVLAVPELPRIVGPSKSDGGGS